MNKIQRREFETILKKSQKELKKLMYHKLKEYGYTPIAEKGFLYAKGEIPVLLIAHLDTVHSKPVKYPLFSG